MPEQNGAYDLCDVDTANLVSSFKSLPDALAMVRAAIEDVGSDAIASWMLGRVDHAGDVYCGEQLVQLALGATDA